MPMRLVVLNPYYTIVQFDDAFADRQPQAETIDFACQSCIHAVETVKNALKVFDGNALARIGDVNLQHLAWDVRRCKTITLKPADGCLHERADTYLDHSTFWRVFDGIFQQVVKHLAQTARIG